MWSELFVTVYNFTLSQQCAVWHATNVHGITSNKTTILYCTHSSECGYIQVPLSCLCYGQYPSWPSQAHLVIQVDRDHISGHNHQSNQDTDGPTDSALSHYLGLLCHKSEPFLLSLYLFLCLQHKCLQLLTVTPETVIQVSEQLVPRQEKKYFKAFLC